jgi:hypothetical protein
VKDILVRLEDRPGELARVGEALGDAGINIEGLMAFAREGRGFAHVLVDDDEAAGHALRTAGLTIETVSDVMVMPIRGEVDRPGLLGKQTRRVADAGVNLGFVYLATGNRVVIGADDLATLRSIAETPM